MILVIGGGFSGVYLAKRLDATLISSRDHFEYTPGILRLFGPKKSNLLTIPFSKMGIKHVCATVTKVDDTHVYFGKKKMEYDTLIICTGAKFREPVSGSKVFSLYNVKDVFNAKKGLNKLRSVGIVGGGLVGVETAAELAHYHPHLDITVYDKNMCKQLCKGSRSYIKSWLKKHGIKNKREYVVSTELHDRYFVCAGMVPNTSFLPSAWLDNNGYVKVNDYLQVSNNVYAAGDIISSNAHKTAQNAELQAKIICSNLLGKNKKYKVNNGVILTSLGPYNAVFEYKGFILKGLFPAILKWLIERTVLWRYK